MSWQASKAVWDTSKQTGNGKLLMLAIAEHSDENGRSWPSIDKLALMIDVTQRSVKRLISECEEAGELVVSRNCGRGNTNEYQITALNGDIGVIKDDIAVTIYENRKGDTGGVKGDAPVIKGDTGGVKGDAPVTQNHKEPSENHKEPSHSCATPSPSADFLEFCKLWSISFPDKAQPRTNNKTLAGKLRTRLKSQHFRDNWRNALTRASKSKFLQDGSWFTADWFLKNDDHYERCLNGNYDDRKQTSVNGNGHIVLAGKEVKQVRGEF